jgi:hypothetical protein
VDSISGAQLPDETADAPSAAGLSDPWLESTLSTRPTAPVPKLHTRPSVGPLERIGESRRSNRSDAGNGGNHG